MRAEEPQHAESEDRGDLVEMGGGRWMWTAASGHAGGAAGEFLPLSPLLAGIGKRPTAVNPVDVEASRIDSELRPNRT